MKKFILFMLTMLLTACSTSQATLSTATAVKPTLISPTETPNPPTETPIVPTPTEIKTFKICKTRAEAKNCPFTIDDLTSGSLIDFATSIDIEPTSPDVVIEKIMLIDRYVDANSYLYWRDFGEAPIPYNRYTKKPSSKPNHAILYGELLGYKGIDFDVKVVRFDQEDGSRGYIQLLCAAKNWGNQAYGYSINMVGEAPIFEGKWGGWEKYNDPETQMLLKKWITDQKIPLELKYKILFEDNGSGR